MNTPTANHLPLNEIVREALSNQHFHMVYQPQFSVRNGELLGFEALIRCRSPRFGLVSPDLFIPYAESSGDIIALGRWITRQSLLDLQNLRRQSGLPLYMSLNISPAQFQGGDVFESVMKCALDFNLPPSAIKLELTETALIQNPELIARSFKAFQSEGMQIWLDDFGTGFASLNLLREFKIDGLKIDKSFIDGLHTNEEDFTICSAIIAMAQRLGLTIVAEGVETEAQMQILGQLGCDSLQGYLLGKPTPAEECHAYWAPVLTQRQSA